jgi:glycosyltransferase involved in cell wall biosynthesis
MKVLTIGLDKNALDFKSQTGQRNLDYTSLVESLEVIVLGAGGEPKQGGNLKVYPTAHNRVWSLFVAYKIGKKILGLAKVGEYLISTQDPFFTGLIGYLLKRKFGIPLQIQIHTEFFNPYFRRESLKNRLQARLVAFLLPRADGIRVVSKKIKEHLMAKLKIPEQKISVLPIFVDIEKIIKSIPKFDLHERYPQFNFIALVASRLTKSKNIGLAIEAVGKATRKYQNLGLVIVGSGPEEGTLKAMALKFKSNIIFEPWTDDLVSYYKTADLYLLTSNYEGWGRTVIEAMAAGCPVISSNVGLTDEVLTSGYNSLVFSVGNKDELVNKILFAIENPESMLKLKTRALETVKSLPNETDYLNNYLKTWQNCFS